MRIALTLIVVIGLTTSLGGCGWLMDKFTCAFGGYAAEGHGC